MWTIIHDEYNDANSVYGIGHHRGIAVILTIVNPQILKELNMEKAFDNFTGAVYYVFTKNLSLEIVSDRFLLKLTLEKIYYKSLETE